VPISSPVIVLPKVPEVVPSVVLLSAVVGFIVVLQQMPLIVIVAPPFVRIVPPDTADVVEIVPTVVVVSVGSSRAVVVN
jgi:hypothetical protein